MLVTPIIQKGQRKRDVYLPGSIPMHKIHNQGNKKVSDHTGTSNLLSSDSEVPSSYSRNTVSGDIDMGDDDTRDSKIVWKQMGTAKGKGRL